jgi:hypothetical protein
MSRLYCIYENNILHFFKRMKPEKTDNLKKKDQDTSYTTKSTRGTVIIQSDISRPPSF